MEITTTVVHGVMSAEEAAERIGRGEHIVLASGGEIRMGSVIVVGDDTAVCTSVTFDIKPRDALTNADVARPLVRPDALQPRGAQWKREQRGRGRHR